MLFIKLLSILSIYNILLLTIKFSLFLDYYETRFYSSPASFLDLIFKIKMKIIKKKLKIFNFEIHFFINKMKIFKYKNINYTKDICFNLL